MDKGAELSNCQAYRYLLWRIWDTTKPTFTFIGLNPSTADAVNDDPTIIRCINFAKSWGGGGIHMLNLFAYRSSYPIEMMNAKDPVGEYNDMYLKEYALKSEKVIACWGNYGGFNNRSMVVKELLNSEFYYFDLNKSGEPKHPLYIKGDAELKKFDGAAVALSD